MFALTAVVFAAVFSAKSPDGANEIRLETGSNLTYSVWRNGEARVVPTAISMNLRGRGELGPNAKATGSESGKAGGKTPTALWKKATLDDSRNETLVRFEGGWSVRLAARNDSAAYRFETDFGDEVEVLGETADVTLPSGDLVCLHNLTNEKPYRGDPFQVSWEQVTQTAAAKDIEAPEGVRHVYAPMLVRFGADEVMGVFESDLRDYPKRDFAKEKDSATFRGVYARVPDEGAVENTRRYIRVHDRRDLIAATQGTRTYPWRLFLLENSPMRLCASEAVNAFASQNALGDVSWVRPGKVAWEWWNDWNVSGVPFKAGSTAFRNVNMETYRHYIDFAAEFGIEYVIMDEGWSKNLDVMQIIPEIDMPALIAYARTKGVGIILWCSWPQLVGRQREVLGHFAKMGVKGFKIDFMDRGDQTVVKFMEETAKVAAEFRLLLDYHGAFPPCGFSRTYPNVVNYEGVFGLEQAKWCAPETDFPANDLTTFFVRMTAGPLDYTPGAMINHTRYRAKPAPSGFRSDYLKPGSQGTRVHQMALLSLFEAPLQMLCDSPTRYRRNAECFRFMAKVPTVWDDTVGLAGDPSRFVLAARRKGAVWYVSGIASWEGASVDADLSFLGPGEWTAEIFEDGVNAEHDAEDYVRRIATVRSGDRFPVAMGPGGGFTMRVSKEEDDQ